MVKEYLVMKSELYQENEIVKGTFGDGEWTVSELWDGEGSFGYVRVLEC